MSIAEAPASSSQAPSGESEAGSTQQIVQFVHDLSETMSKAVKDIKEVNSRTLLLSLNAKIEAHRAGSAGAAFGVVANEMQELAAKTTIAADSMENNARVSIDDLQREIQTSIRGSRLSDLALTNIDLVDRNLYERTCDVRWWATDSSLVDALQEPTPESSAFASKRLGVILDAYTVYHDLVLCDMDGNVVANGRPDQYKSVGQNVSSSVWFRKAAQSSSGDDYGFATAERSNLVNQQAVLTYSCGVRQGGESRGRLLGVLGIMFDWESFAQTIMEQTPISPSEKHDTRCVLCDDEGNILADSMGQQLQEKLDLDGLRDLMAKGKGFASMRYAGRNKCIGYGKAPGFETYSTGWHSFIMQAE